MNLKNIRIKSKKFLFESDKARHSVDQATSIVLKLGLQAFARESDIIILKNNKRDYRYENSKKDRI